MSIFNFLKKKTKSNYTKNDLYQPYYGEAKIIKKSLADNIKIIKELLGSPNDLIVREFSLGENYINNIAIINIEGLTNTLFINDFILRELMVGIIDFNSNEKIIDKLKNHSLPINNVKELTNFKEICESLLNGDTILLLDNSEKGLILETKKWEDRGVTEPSAETVVRGSRDSFNETLRTNIMLIRRRIKNINLRIVHKEVGKVTKTNVAIVYVKGIANERIVSNVLNKIDQINIDSVLESGYIEEILSEKSFVLFPTMYTSERPDKVAGNLLEGRVAIFTDGTPFTLLLPAVFIQFFQTTEDYNQGSIFSSFLRLIRYLSFFLALLTPAIYIAITTFHQEMLPTPLLVSIAGQHESVPFPAVIEVIIMELTFEILREAGLRMPRAIGQAISIVGALVLGEAAVNAGIVSTIMIIIVSITAITSLIFPEYNFSNPIRILRFVFIALSAFLGLFGITMGLMIMIIYLCSLQSFGIPYMYPLAPFNFKAMKDALIRANIKNQSQKPNLIVNDYMNLQDENKQ